MMDQDKVNILLVDDQPAKLLAYEVILKELGENLVKAASGREALEFLLKNDVAIILVDVCMVFGYVKQSGGHIKIYSEEGHGTSVKMYLPRATGLNQIAAEAQVAAKFEGGSETVLVVEDDALVRRYVMTQIESLGYATLEAVNGADALRVIDGAANIDLLFTDVIM